MTSGRADNVCGNMGTRVIASKQTVSVRLNGFGSNWEIVDFDEDWVKLSREGIKQHRVTKLIRIEDVELIQQLR